MPQSILYKLLKFKCLVLSIGLFFISLLTGCDRLTDANQKDDGIPPAVPINVQITYSSDGEILIEWNANAEADLKGYNVYRKTENTEYSFLSFTSNNYFFDDSLYYDSTYYYKVTAVDIWNEESSPSAEVHSTPLNKYKPQKPRYLYINARNYVGKMSIYLSWFPSNESDIAGYNIYRSLNSSFTSDSSNLIAFSPVIEFTDTLNLKLYSDYYYKVQAVDKGGLLSDESSMISDHINEMAEMIYPPNDATVNYFSYFKIKTIKLPADYQIIVQSNEYSGEIWSSYFSSSIIDDTIDVKFNPPALYPYTNYYWRILTYTNSNSEPNSISTIYKFKVKN